MLVIDPVLTSRGFKTHPARTSFIQRIIDNSRLEDKKEIQTEKQLLRATVRTLNLSKHQQEKPTNKRTRLRTYLETPKASSNRAKPTASHKP